jgi:RimJ/RimL family protein N-acetyltransferase
MATELGLNARLMTRDEIHVLIDYFHDSSPEHLETLGVDPTRLPERDAWHQRMLQEFSLPLHQRTTVLIAWLLREHVIGFSSADRIVFGDRANMHLHVIDVHQRRLGLGTECVRQSVDIYFEELRLKRLFCEPNAFNVAPNRALQKAGFKYVKTHMTVPGPLNFHQAVTRWLIER